jgi:hypothetical protein
LRKGLAVEAGPEAPAGALVLAEAAVLAAVAAKRVHKQ